MINENQLVPYEASELPVANGPWLVFAPHADDESFGMGGTLLKAAEKGITVHLVVMTDGALGGNTDNLVEIRKQEAIRAAAMLGLQSPVFLEYQDRGLRLEQEVVERVCEVIGRVAPAAVFFPACFELHPDHRATAALVWQALRKFAKREIVPVSYEVLVQSPVNTLVDISPYVAKKEAVMAVYESQLSENVYIEIASSLNRLRSLTLAGDISHAEGYYRFVPTDVDTDFEEVVLSTLRLYFLA